MTRLPGLQALTVWTLCECMDKHQLYTFHPFNFAACKHQDVASVLISLFIHPNSTVLPVLSHIPLHVPEVCTPPLLSPAHPVCRVHEKASLLCVASSDSAGRRFLAAHQQQKASFASALRKSGKALLREFWGSPQRLCSAHLLDETLSPLAPMAESQRSPRPADQSPAAQFVLWLALVTTCVLALCLALLLNTLIAFVNTHVCLFPVQQWMFI